MIQAKPTIIELDMDKLEEILRRLEPRNSTQTTTRRSRRVIGSYVLPGQRGGRQGHHDPPAAADALRCEDREDGGGGRQQDGAGASVVAWRRRPGWRRPRSPRGSQHGKQRGSSSASRRPERFRGVGEGHGRNGADAYSGAEKIEVRHASLQPGDPCPQCEEGTVYETGRPGVLVRLVGQAPVGAKVYYLQKLRCNLCGVVFTAEPPEGVGEKKYDATVGSMIALLKYGSGMPFNREETLQESLGDSLAGLDPVGHRRGPGGACRAGL